MIVEMKLLCSLALAAGFAIHATAAESKTAMPALESVECVLHLDFSRERNESPARFAHSISRGYHPDVETSIHALDLEESAALLLIPSAKDI